MNNDFKVLIDFVLTKYNVEVEEKDIELVMAQAQCSEEKARKALIANNMDIVNAILDEFRIGL